MQSDFRSRAFTPVVLPLALVGAVLLIAWSLAQVLLLVSAGLAAAIALFLALYVLIIASLVASRRRISSRTLTVSLAVGLISIVAAGAIARAAGPRPLEEHGEEVAAEDGSEAPNPDIPAGAEVFVAVDIDFEAAPETLPAGEVTIAIDNQGETEHNVAFEELGGDIVVEAGPGEVDTGTVTVEPGEYTYFCDVPGHRGSGMEGTLTVQ